MASLSWFVLLLAGLTYTNAVGTRETIQNVPSMVQVEFRVILIWTHQCAASLITNSHYLTAITCSRSSPPDLRIRLGTATSGWGGITRSIGNIVNHPIADLSVVRITAAVWFGPTIQNIPIAPQGFGLSPYVPVSLVGWGSTAQGGLLTNNYLYRVEIESKNNTICSSQYPVGRVTPDHLCVGLLGRPGRDFDDDDAGAPIIYLGNLVGVASFGEILRNDVLPIVSTSVGSYTNWIASSVV